METRAHFVLIGLFTLLGIVGGLGFFVWLASVQIDRQYAQYGVLFDNVAGLNQSAEVLFNGVGVGRVVAIDIWDDDPSKVFVAIEIDAATPVAVDTVAQLQSQGVTGVAYIALSGGSSGAARLMPTIEGEPPIIPSQQSSFQSLVDTAPDILGDAAILIQQLESLTSVENQETLRRVLTSIEGATDSLDRILADAAETMPTLRTTTEDFQRFTATLAPLSEDASDLLNRTDTALARLTDTLETATPAINSVESAFAALNGLITDDLSPLATQTRGTLTTANDALAQINAATQTAQTLMTTDIAPALADARTAVSAFADTLTVVQTELRSTASAARTAITSVTPALRDFGQLGAEARTLVRNINDFVRQLSREPSRLLLDNRVPDYRR